MFGVADVATGTTPWTYVTANGAKLFEWRVTYTPCPTPASVATFGSSGYDFTCRLVFRQTF